MNHTYGIGDKVRANDTARKNAGFHQDDRAIYTGQITEIVSVPAAQQASVGHHQWVRVNDNSLISALLIEPDIS